MKLILILLTAALSLPLFSCAARIVVPEPPSVIIDTRPDHRHDRNPWRRDHNRREWERWEWEHRH